jgi:hypothetical protein
MENLEDKNRVEGDLILMDSNQEKKSKRRIYLDTNLQIIFGVTLTYIMGVSSITPAFPRMVQELNISVKDIGLLITFFTFPFRPCCSSESPAGHVSWLENLISF